MSAPHDRTEIADGTGSAYKFVRKVLKTSRSPHLQDVPHQEVRSTAPRRPAAARRRDWSPSARQEAAAARPEPSEKRSSAPRSRTRSTSRTTTYGGREAAGWRPPGTARGRHAGTSAAMLGPRAVHNDFAPSPSTARRDTLRLILVAKPPRHVRLTEIFTEARPDTTSRSPRAASPGQGDHRPAAPPTRADRAQQGRARREQQPAITHWRSRHGAPRQPAQCRLETGRTHQIRRTRWRRAPVRATG
jgi:hypothetical protein